MQRVAQGTLSLSDSEKTQGTLREHPEHTQRTVREHSQHTQGTLREHSENIQSTLREHSGTLTAHSENTPVTLREHSENTQTQKTKLCPLFCVHCVNITQVPIFVFHFTLTAQQDNCASQLVAQFHSTLSRITLLTQKHNVCPLLCLAAQRVPIMPPRPHICTRPIIIYPPARSYQHEHQTVITIISSRIGVIITKHLLMFFDLRFNQTGNYGHCQQTRTLTYICYRV